MFILSIIGKFSAKRILQVELDTRQERLDGLMDLFIDLAGTGSCRSYMASRIYYLAYLLSEKYPELKFGVEEREL